MVTPPRFDAKDLEILSLLRQNSRQSIKQIARLTHLGKDVVRYRMKKLEERGTIKRYMSHFDYSALGYQSYRTYLKLQHTTPEIDKQVYEGIKQIPGMRIMGRFEGEWNFGWVTIARSPYQYSQVLDVFLHKFSKYIQRKEVNLLVEQRRYHLVYGTFKPQNENFELYEQSLPKPYDEQDARILETLLANSRTPLVTIATKVGLTARTVNDRIKRLKKVGILVSFGVDVDVGFTYYKLMVNLEDATKMNKIYSFAQKHRKHIGAVFRALGGSDCELDIYTNTFQEFLGMIDTLKAELKQDIKNYSYHTISKLYIPETLKLY